MSVGGYSSFIRILPQNTYFSFHSQSNEHVDDVGMSSPVSPTVAYLYMKYFQQKALSTAPTP